MRKRLLNTFIVSILAGISTALIVELYLRPRLPEIQANLTRLVGGAGGIGVA